MNDFKNLTDLSEYFNAEKLQKAFDRLVNISEGDDVNQISNSFLFGVGNNHAGTFYAVIKDVLPVVIDMARTSENKLFVECTFNLLIDLYYFEADGDSFLDEDERLACQKLTREMIFDLQSYKPFYDFLIKYNELPLVEYN